jgi:hypothetical protein
MTYDHLHLPNIFLFFCRLLFQDIENGTCVSLLLSSFIVKCVLLSYPELPTERRKCVLSCIQASCR